MEITNSKNGLLKYLPQDTTVLDNQVAGHSFQEGKNTIGMLKQEDGRVLKPATKKREVDFYENLKNSNDTALQNFVPKYYGTRILSLDKQHIKFIILENITNGMVEPSVIDIKIGKITWDLYATEEKIQSEKTKYCDTKRSLALCIPGFKVYNIDTSQLFQFGKDYGRKLNQDTFISSIKLFLNGSNTINQHLLFQILGQLWRILYWCRTQTQLLIFSSSILIVYDTCKLRKCQKTFEANNNQSTGISYHLTRRKSVLQLLDQSKKRIMYDTEKMWHRNFNKFNFHLSENLEKQIDLLRKIYFSFLEEKGISSISIEHQWVKVKMIDFAHVFSSNNKLDENYLEGIENLVTIFERFFLETYYK